MGYQPGKPGPERGFQGEGLLGIVPPEGAARLWAATGPDIASIRVRAERDVERAARRRARRLG